MRESLSIPEELAAVCNGWTAALVWSHTPELATYRLERDSVVRYLKLARVGWDPPLSAERARLDWAARRLRVPPVIDNGTAADLEWMLTEAIPGKNATEKSLGLDARSLVTLLGAGLRALHDTPVAGCPFDSSLDVDLAIVRARVQGENIDVQRDFHDEHKHMTPQTALEHLETHRPTSEDLVLTHGDYCLPNVLIEEGRVTGYVDLGEFGIADRWRDIAVGTQSVTWNLGPGFEETFLDAYGIELDPQRCAYYRLLYDCAGGTFIA